MKRPALVVTAAAVITPAACGIGGPTMDEAALVYQESPPTWLANHRDRAAVDPQGSRIYYGGGLGWTAGTVEQSDSRPPRVVLDSVPPVQGHTRAQIVQMAVSPTGHAAALLDSLGWRRLEADGSLGAALDLPADAYPAWSADGSRVLYRDSDAQERLIVREAGTERTLDLGLAVADYGWRGRTDQVVAMLDQGDGSVALVQAGPDGRVETIVPALDGVPRSPRLGLDVAGDGRFAVVSAVAVGPPDLEAKHAPEADRDLDLYRVDLPSGRTSLLIGTPGDDIAPQIRGEHLFWTSTTPTSEVVVVPVDGGEPRVVASPGEGPTWRPDSRAIGFYYGAWRAADFALNLDGAVVELNGDAESVSDPAPVVTGYHEDFGPVWSPDGRWIAYHSHRSTGPVPSYAAAGSTDDVYLRPAGSPPEAEIRLTDWGLEAGSPDWHPDSDRVLFTAMDPETHVDQPWIVTIDTETGQPTGRTPVDLPRGVGAVLSAAWSPDGQTIAIAAQEADSVQALWVLQEGGAGRVTAFVMDTYGGIDWLPDGENLVVAARLRGDMRLFRVPTSGGNAYPLTPEGQHVFKPAVSPDGRWIAATRIETLKQVWRVPLP